MKIAFIGCVTFSKKMLHQLLCCPSAEIVGIVTRESSPFNADFESLQPSATELGIPCFIAEGNNQSQMADWLIALRPDVIYCLGWSFLLKREVLAIPKHGAIGYHPAALPNNRGRHPIVWALALGLSETASTFFFMNESADSGDIISQKRIPIDCTDDAGTLYSKLTDAAAVQLIEFTSQVAAGTHTRTPQSDNLANYWRKRTAEDGKIDWRMTADSVYNLIRALTYPYVGAHCVYRGEMIKIWKADLLTATNAGIENIEPGKIINSEGQRISVKCGSGIITLTKHEFLKIPQSGEYL